MFAARLALRSALVLFITLIPVAAEAQLGGIVKKARDRVVPGQTQTVDEAARLPGPQVTPDIVKRLLSGLAAERRARDRVAQEIERRRVADSVAQAERQRPGYYANREECLSVKLQADTAYPGLERLLNEASAAGERNDIAKTSEIAQRMVPIQMAMQQRAEAACASVPPASAMPAPAAQPTPQEQAVQQSPDTLEGVGARAGGFSATEYAQLKELIHTYLNYPQKAGLAADEKRAVDPKRKELKESLSAIGLR